MHLGHAGQAGHEKSFGHTLVQSNYRMGGGGGGIRKEEKCKVVISGFSQNIFPTGSTQHSVMYKRALGL